MNDFDSSNITQYNRVFIHYVEQNRVILVRERGAISSLNLKRYTLPPMLHKTNTGGRHVVLEINQRSLLFSVFLILTHNVLTIVGTNTCISTNVTHACKEGRRQIHPSEKNMLVFFKICQNLNNCISGSALCDDSATYTQISTRTFFIGEHN